MFGGWRIALWAAVVIAVLFFLYMVRGILLPFIAAFIFAALLEPLVRKLRLRGMSRFWSVTSVLVPFYGGVIILGTILTPQITSQVSRLSTSIDQVTASFSQSSDNNNYFLRWNPAVQEQSSHGIEASLDNILKQFHAPLQKLGLPTTRQEILDEYVEPHRGDITKAVRVGFDSFFGVLGSLAHQLLSVFIMVLLIPMYLLSMEDFKRKAPRWIPPSIRTSTMNILGDIGQVFIKYLRGVASVVILYIVAAAILLSLLNVPYAILLAVAFGTIYMIPYFGNIVAYAVIFAVVGFSDVHGTLGLQLNSPWLYAAIATIIYVVMGLVFDHILYPSMVGNAVGLNSVVSLFVIFSGAALFGLVGMIIAFPLAGSVKVILDRVIRFTSITQDTLSLPAVPVRHRRTAAS